MKSLIFSVLFVFSVISFAHEGHGPVQKMSPHGGVLKDGKAIMAELVQDTSGVKIYFLTHDSKPVFAKEIKLDSKTIQLTDGKKKNVPFEILPSENAIVLKFDKTKSYRYNLTLPFDYQNAPDKLTWQFEPQAN